MPSRLVCLISALLVLNGPLPGASVQALAQSAPTLVGWVEIVPSQAPSDQLTVVGHAYATGASSGRYTLVVSRIGKGGTTNTQQGGSFNVAPRENKKLSSTTINVGAEEALNIELKLFVEDKEVFSVVLQPTPHTKSRNI